MSKTNIISSSDAPRALRIAAFLLDAMLAVLLTLGLRLLVRFEFVGSIGHWTAFDGGPLVDFQLLWIAAVLTALRDVILGSSPAKWLLCIELTSPQGNRMALLNRLLRAPFSLFPTAILPHRLQHRFPWQVRTYSPSRLGLLLRTGLTAGAATFSVIWAVEAIRPSIGAKDTHRISQSLVMRDPLLEKTLGAPLDYEIGHVTRRARQRQPGQRASFSLRIQGGKGQQRMVVHLRKLDNEWRLEEIRDIEISSTVVDSTRMARH